MLKTKLHRRALLLLCIILTGMSEFLISDVIAGSQPPPRPMGRDKADVAVPAVPATPNDPQARDPNPMFRQPPLWQLRPALPAPQLAEDPNAPVVNVSREAALTAPRGGDLDPNIDVQITQEIIDKAAELGSAQAIYEFVRNECEFQPYYGSLKGSVETLRQQAGNDYDLASLLIALLRASNIPARYAVGMAEMKIADAKSWLAVDDPFVPGSILFTNGMEGVSIVSGPNVVAVRARRVWVEAYVPHGFGSPVWTPLDPAFHRTLVSAGQDILEEMGGGGGALDAQNFVDEYFDPTDPMVTLPRSETLLEILQEQVTDYLAANYPGLTLDDARRTHEIVAEELGALPNSLPYVVRSRDLVFSEIPAARRYQIQFELYNGGSTMIDYTGNLPEIAGRRVTIDYVGNSPGDQAAIDAAGGIYALSMPSSVILKPVLRINGELVATGAAGLGIGYVHSSDVHFLAPVNGQGLPQNVVPAIFNTITCGASQAIGFSVEGVSESLLVPPPADDTEGTLSLVWDTAMDYLAEVHEDDMELGRLMHSFVTTDVADAIVENVVRVTYNGLGVPQSFDWVGLRVDADRSIVGVWPVDLYPPTTEPRDFLLIGGANGSAWEHFVYERNFGQDSVSTMKILQLAIDAGITVYKRWDTLPLPSNTQPTSVRNALINAINNGHEVTFPADPMTIGNIGTGQWSGTGWIDADPIDGAAGYIISGNNNGGATYESWPPEFIDLQEDNKSVTQVTIEITEPDADSPDCDSIFTRDNEQNLAFKYLVHVTYDDASMATLGPYEKRTQNTTRSFFPGNYTFKVWISRRVWWFFNSTIAEAERKVSIVAVLVRKDDGSEFGAKPPKLLGTRLPAPGMTPSVDVKALVIPAMAPDGSTLASAYMWSGGPRLMFLTPTTQMTKIEPTDANPSGMIDDQEVNVVVTLPCGKQQMGYGKLDLKKGGMDEKHKMTVHSIEIDKCPMAFLPQGGSMDNTVVMTARARPMDMQGQFIFELTEETSQEDGYCSNAPKNMPFFSFSEDGSSYRDLHLEDQAGYNIDGIFWRYKAKGDADNVNTATVTVTSYDYGAFGRIKAEFNYKNMDVEETLKAYETAGHKEYTNIPLDDDDNHIADMWMDNAGMANDDNDANPAGMTVGDGLSRYEEYRGFMVMGTHTRTRAVDKNVFIRDHDGMGLGLFGTSNLTTHLITADEFNGTDKREINFRHDSHHVVLQHGLWLRDMDLGPMGSWGNAEAVGSPGTAPRVQVKVDKAQINADMTNFTPVGFRPPMAANRSGAALPQIIGHELGHAVAVFHHGPGHYPGTHTGDTSCVMRYYFTDMQTAAAMAPPAAAAAAFNAVAIGTTFCNTAPDTCRSDVDVSDQ